MQNFQDISDKIFIECKDILGKISEIKNVEELLQKQDLFYQISEKISFLKGLKQNEDHLIAEISLLDSKNKQLISENEEKELSTSENQSLEISEKEEIKIDTEKQEPLFTFANELENTEQKNETAEQREKLDLESKENISENVGESLNLFDVSSEKDTSTQENLERSNILAEENLQPISEQKEIEPKEAEERRRKIVEIEKPHAEIHKQENYFMDEKHEKEELHHDKKFKLANIKGLKSVQSLFDDDPLEKLEEEKKQEKSFEKTETGSLLKTNIPTDFMEAEKPKPEFRLDLNDKIAFSQKLFGGSQSELNDTVNQLNTFKNLDEAKEYLSELYYEKNWKKVDEYAQRLWTLVENKFL